MPVPRIEFPFPHEYEIDVLPYAPMLIEEPRQFVYPAHAEEVERGALVVRITPQNAPKFVAVCAPGFDSPLAITGIFSTPNPHWACAVSSGYAYLINTIDPQEWHFVASRPALEVRAAIHARVLLFADFQTISGFTAETALWQTGALSWEGLKIEEITGAQLKGLGWDAIRDQELPFAVDLASGEHTGGATPRKTGASPPDRPATRDQSRLRR